MNAPAVVASLKARVRADKAAIVDHQSAIKGLQSHINENNRLIRDANVRIAEAERAMAVLAPKIEETLP